MTSPGVPQRHLIDVTIRSPHASRYPNAHRTAATAAAAAEKEKRDLYGEDVLPLAFESYGRIGKESYSALQSLALATASCRVDSYPGRLCHEWRDACETAVHFATADVALLALGAGAAAAFLRRSLSD